MKVDHWAKKLFKSSFSSSANHSPQPSTFSSSAATASSLPAPASSTTSLSPEFSPSSSCTGSVTSDPSSPTTASEPSKKQRPIFGFTVKNASVHSLLNLAFNSSTAHSISKSHHPSTTSLVIKNGAHITGIGGDNHNDTNHSNDGDDDPETTTIYYHPPGDTQQSEQEHLMCKRDRAKEEQQRLREAKQQLTQRKLEILGCVLDARASSPDLHQTSHRCCTSLPTGQYSSRSTATNHALAFSERTSSRSDYERTRSRSGSLPSSTPASRMAKALDPTSAHQLYFQQKQAASTTATYIQSRFDQKEGGERPWSAWHSVDSIKRLRASVASMSKFGDAPSFRFPLDASSHPAQDQAASPCAPRRHGHVHEPKSPIAMETPCCPHNTPIVSGSLDIALQSTLVLIPTTSMTPHGLMTEDASKLARMQYSEQGYNQLVKVIDNLSTTVQDLSYKMATMMDFTAGVYSPTKSSSSVEADYQEQHGGGIGSGFDYNFGSQTQHRGGNILQPLPLVAASCSQRMSVLSNEPACYAQPPSSLSSSLLSYPRQRSASTSTALWNNHRTRRYIVVGPHLLQTLPPPPGGPLPSTPEGHRSDIAVPIYPASDQPPPPRRPPPPPPSYPGLVSATRATASAITHRSTPRPSQPLRTPASSTFKDNTNTSDEDMNIDMTKARTLALEIQHELEMCQSTLLTLLSFSPPPPSPPPPSLPPLAPAHRLLNKIDHNMDPSHSNSRSQQTATCTCHTKDNTISSQPQDTRSGSANMASTARTKHDGDLVKTTESATATYVNTYNPGPTPTPAPARPPRPPHVTEDLREMLNHIESRLELLQYEWPQLFATSQPPSPSSSSSSSLEGTKDSELELSRGIEVQYTNSNVGTVRVAEEKGQEMKNEDGKKTCLDKDLHRMVMRLQRELLLIQREHGRSIDL